MSLTVVSVVSFFSFFNLKRYFTALIVAYSSRIGPSIVIYCEIKSITFPNNRFQISGNFKQD